MTIFIWARARSLLDSIILPTDVLESAFSIIVMLNSVHFNTIHPLLCQDLLLVHSREKIPVAVIFLKGEERNWRNRRKFGE